MAKKTSVQIVLECLTNLAEANRTLANAEKILKMENLDPSIRTTISVAERYAKENRDSCVGKIFRRVQDHIGSDEANLRQFVQKVFPSLSPSKASAVEQK